MKLGLIDYYLDEFHANNYPQWIKDASGGELIAAYAYAQLDSTVAAGAAAGGLTTAQWCEKHGLERIDTIEEIVAKSDALIVLSPDNPEQHEALCALPLASGKRTYIDKTFAETKAVAERIFAVAEAHGTPCYSSSALRFVEEYRTFRYVQVAGLTSFGPGPLEAYSIHQIEPMVALMGPDAARVQFTGTDKHPAYVCEYRDGRRATLTHHGWECPFGMVADFKDGSTRHVTVETDLFRNFIRELVDFFRTGNVKVPHEETIAVIAVREAALKAAKAPGEWVDV
jgi:predicted dehydrogenase